MRATSTNHLFFLLCALFLGGGQVLAQDQADDRPRPPAPTDGANDGANDGQRGHRRPPEAAFTACADLKQDDVCEVQLKERTIEGHCVPAHDEDKLFCAPERPQGPPPEALSACADKSAGDSCSVTGPDGQALPEGVCSNDSHGLACRPSAPPSAR